MEKQKIATMFCGLVTPSHPNEWEVEELVDSLELLSEESCLGLLSHIPAIWPISHSLCYAYLRYGAVQIDTITLEFLPEWVRQILYRYEQSGLRGAEAFMADAKGYIPGEQKNGSSVSFSDISTRMTHYIRGISGGYLMLHEDKDVWTDTEFIYLPPATDVFSTTEANKLLLKFLVTYQWTLITLGAFRIFGTPAASDNFYEVKGAGETDDLKKLLNESKTAGYLFKLYLFIKGCLYIKKNLPGLWRRGFSLISSKLEQILKAADSGSGKELQLQCWDYVWRGLEDRQSHGDVLFHSSKIETGECLSFVNRWQSFELKEISLLEKLLLGKLHFDRAEVAIQKQRELDRQTFIKMLARIIPESPMSSAENSEHENPISLKGQDTDGAVGVISESLNAILNSKDRKTLQFNNQNIIVPEELVELARKISSEFGAIPVGYIQAASGLAGQGRVANSLENGSGEPPAPPCNNSHIYDEWDCRRAGYRKDWCTVTEEELPVTISDFIPQTLHKHSGLRKKLRVQFEQMRLVHRFVRRKRDGDDLDLDAITDAIGDQKAGKSASDRLFVRLQRNERSITTLFLIDMSNSTSGWIGTFIKESLVLLCEAMEKVGDQYGIYGFSGMKRSGCKLYHLKRLDERYDEETRKRISAISPKDYTRMAPAIRHLTTLLEKSEFKTRLLITLSDGKPEDYDGYNGEYAIEDTRKALLEARGKGINPFCITVDKQAHSYLDHMFGAGNYIFINRIENLPAKMAQIYRALTT